MSQLQEVTFTDLLSTIIDNRGKTCPTAESGIPLIATNCIKEDRVNPVFENVRYVSEETYSTWFRGHPEPNDILFVCKGSPGRVAVVPDPVPFCIAQDMVSVRADANRAHPRYLYYLLKLPSTREKIEGMHVGTMIPHFKKGDFGKLRLLIHEDLGEQKAIAEVLGALDDKVVANARLAATAQELASTLFRQAVVSAEYSGMTFGDLAEVGGGGTPSTKEPDLWDGTTPWATPTDVTGLAGPYLEDTSRKITSAGLAACASSLYPAGTILMTSRATIGAFAVAQVPMSVNQGFIAVQPKDESMRYWFYHEMRDRVDQFIAMANGATFLELSRGNFKKFEVRLADQDVMLAFCQKADPLHHAARRALVENRALATTRDALLPQLLSGKLRAKDAEDLVTNIK